MRKIILHNWSYNLIILTHFPLRVVKYFYRKLLEESLKKAIKLNKTALIEVPIGETLSPFIFGVHAAD